MIGRWLSWLNCAIVGFAILFGFAGIVYWFKQPSEIVCDNPLSKECGLPKGAFEQSKEAYQDLGSTLLALNQGPFSMQLPDLRQQLVYHGKNGRPDAQLEKTLVHFSISGNPKATASIKPKENLYLVYDRKSGVGRYNFSPSNEKTSLWIEVEPTDHEAQITVGMENGNGEKITEPENFASFRLTEKDASRAAISNWEIGSIRVDGTLLARQKARWQGGDKFLEKHGGDDFKDILGRQRIDLGENDDLYSVFVKAGDCLIWQNNRWCSVSPGEESLKHPLLVVKKVDERLMNLELWDVDGKNKVILNLLKGTEPWTIQNAQVLQPMFKFLGARTRTQCVFEINRERMILKPSDWLLLTSKGWKKLASEEEIDKYVKRQLTGTLFVFDGLKRKGDKQIMTGTIYSPSRHDCQPVELALLTKDKKNAANKDPKDKEKNGRVVEEAMAQRNAAGARTGESLAPGSSPIATPTHK